MTAEVVDSVTALLKLVRESDSTDMKKPLLLLDEAEYCDRIDLDSINDG